jgi:hypothetical protein
MRRSQNVRIRCVSLALVAGCAIITGCKSRGEEGSATSGLIANRTLSDGKNVAVLSSNAPLGAASWRLDEAGESGNGGIVVHALEAVLQAPPYSLQTHEVIDAAKAETVLERLREAALEVGRDGTLLWFHHGVGLDRGELVFPDTSDTIHSMRLAQELSGVLQGRLLRRLVVILDSDYSGRWLSPGEGMFSGWHPKVAQEIVVLTSSARDATSHSPYLSFALAEQLKAAATTAPAPSLRAVFGAVTTAVRERVANEKLVNQEPVFGAFPATVLDQAFFGESGPAATGTPEVANREDEWVYQCRGELEPFPAADDPDPWEPYGWRWAFVGKATSLPSSFLECKGWSRFTNSCSSVTDANGAEVPCDKSVVGKLAFTKT